jgi:glycosyltransferase involved in cell wall biosynthesis
MIGNKHVVDIILPVYNSEIFLLETLNSIVSQSYKSWRLIIIDDGSIDNTRNILKVFFNNKKFKSKILILYNKKNKGQSFCRNLGLERSVSKYVAFIDSDDLWEKNKLKKQIYFMENKDCSFSYTDYKIFNKNTLYSPYSISLKKFKHVKLLPNNKKIKILYVGQLIKRKGINLILESLKHLDKRIIKHIELTFVGKGPLEELIRKFSIIFKFIYLKKFKNRKNLNETYSKNNIFLYPSIYDGWGVAPMEAMASGMAIIISKNVGLAENLKHNKNGLIISANAVEISKAIKFYYNQKKKITEHGKNNINLISSSALNSELNVTNVTKFLINIVNDSN